MPQNFSDLGLSSDKITSITRVSGDGAAGSLDTYNIKTRANPSGTGFNFTVQNGTNGTSGNAFQYSVPNTVTTKSALQDYINNNYSTIGFSSVSDAWDSLSSIIFVGYGSGIGGSFEQRFNCIFVINKQSSAGEFDVLMAYNGTELADVNTLATDAGLDDEFFILVFAGEKVVAQLDDNVNRHSVNAVQNTAIGDAVSVGVGYYYNIVGGMITRASVPPVGYQYTANVNQYYVIPNLPFYDDYGDRHPVYKYVGHGVEGTDPEDPQATADCVQYLSATLDLESDGIIVELVTFDTTQRKVNRKVTLQQATNADIDALFPTE